MRFVSGYLSFLLVVVIVAVAASRGGAQVIHHHERQHLSKAQRMTLELLRQGYSQAEIAKQLRITKQAVSLRAQGAGWEAFAEGERAWRAALKRFDFSAEWER